ncbi:MAG: hypothetical protein KJ995_01445 [Candidatus Omnitrophica bacterium]|nr:hypothetical protein [Candidatus Omnitrophota bacterium]MBU1128056.1 hypothetical protein [Candidatus Omnitrophota bacterium]MBU1851055.1 hypothetical protein [Candidatus Omnitrophota bacterium]
MYQIIEIPLRLKSKYERGEITLEESQLLIALETGWTPDEKEDTGLVRVLNKLSRLAKEQNLSNIIIRRGKGAKIASEIRQEAGKKNIPRLQDMLSKLTGRQLPAQFV